MRIIAVANQKGGCGKTTTAINLGASLSKKEKKVLLIDTDPQAHATMGLNVNPADLEKSIYDILRSGDRAFFEVEDIIVPVSDNFNLVPSSAKLSALEQELSGVEGRESRLWEAIGSIKEPYDYILIDSPPSIGHLSFNALRACEEVIIPIDLSLFSLRGVSKLMEIILLLKEELGHEIIARALITMYDFRTRYARQVLERVKEEFGENVFETVIRYNIRLRETVDYGLPIGDYDKRAIGHMDYENLAEEVVQSGLIDRDLSYSSLNSAQNFLEKTEGYIDSSEKQDISERPFSATDEFASYVQGSAYENMAETLAVESTDSVFYAGDETEES